MFNFVKPNSQVYYKILYITWIIQIEGFEKKVSQKVSVVRRSFSV